MSAASKIPQFRRQMHELVDLICDYFETIETRPAKATASPGDIRAILGDTPPAAPAPWEDTKHTLLTVIFQNANHWQHPRNHGYYPCSTSFPGIMGEMVSKAINNPGFSWHVSPINTELEILMNDWVATALGLPEFYKHSSRLGGGLTHGTASESLLVAMIGARNRSPGEHMVVYASELAHFSTMKTAKILGVEFRPVPITACQRTHNYIMDVPALSSLIASDRSQGKTPIMVVATWGSTATCSLDPIRAISEVTQREQVWLHIDAAYAGSALICPEYRPLIDGLDQSDSFNFNGHKWLLTGFNNSVLYVKEPKYLTQSLSATGTYILPSKPEETDFMTWQVPQGRDFRSIRWWMLMRCYGVEGLQGHIRRTIGLAKTFEDLIRSSPDFSVPFPSDFGLVCFTVKDSDQLTRQLADRLQSRKDSIFTSAELRGQKILRLVICSEYTEEKHVREAFETVKEELEVAKRG